MKRLLFALYLCFTIVLSYVKAHACSAANINISASGNGNCQGGQMLLIVFVDDPNGPNGTFEWSRKFGPLPTGIPTITTDAFAVVNPFLPSYNGIYYVTYTDQNGCTSLDSIELNVIANPSPYIDEYIHCYGIELVAHDSFPNYLPNTYSWMVAATSSQSIVYSGSGGMGSNQTVTITNAMGCSAQYFTNQLTPVPLSVTVAGSRKIVLGGSTILTANANYAVKSYLWYKGNNYILGAYKKSFTVVDTGTYRVRVISTENCKVNKYIKVIYKAGTLRIEDGAESLSENLIAYPNPASNEVQLGGLEIGENRLYDLTGRVVKIIYSENSNYTLMIDDLNPGIYLLRSGEQSIRIVKQ